MTCSSPKLTRPDGSSASPAALPGGFVTGLIMWYLVLSTLVPGADEGRRQHFGEHMDWLCEIHREGRALFSGPTSDRQIGIYVLLGDTLEEARQLAASDPHHIYGERTAEVFEWEVMQAMRLEDGKIEEIEAMVSGPERSS